jgi:XRE family transcriptional regulator, regulator of sulfur utilization
VATPLRQRKIIGDAIRKYRKQAALTQEGLAEKAELHPVYIGELERGEQTVNVYGLMKIAKALGVRVRDLVADI